MELKKGNLKNVDVSIFENIGGIFLSFKIDGQIVYTNSQFMDELGYEFPEIQKITLWDLIPITDHKAIRDQILYVSTTQDSASGSIKLGSKYTREILYNYTFSFVLDATDSPLIIALFRQISEVDYQEQIYEQNSQLAEERLMLTSIIEKNPFAIGIFDETGEILDGNLEFKQLWGGEFPLNYNILKDQTFFISKDKQKIKSRIQNQSITKTVLFNPRVYSSNYPDRPYWIQITVFSVKNSDGSINSIIAMYKDINDQVETKLTLQEYQRHLEDLVSERTKELEYRLSFEKIISEISSQFVGQFTLNNSIPLVISKLGIFCDSDHVLLFTYNMKKTNHLQVNQFYQWSKAHISRFEKKEIIYEIEKSTPWKELLSSNNIISFSDLDSTDEKIKSYFKNMKYMTIRSLLAYPITIDGEPIAFLMLFTNTKKKKWKEIHFTLLQVTSETLTTAFTRHFTELELAKERSTLNNVIELNPYGILLLDTEGHILQTNPTMKQILPPFFESSYSLFQDDTVLSKRFSAEIDRLKNGSIVKIDDFEYEFPISEKNQRKTITLRAIAFPLLTEHHVVKKFVVMVEDITQIKEAEKEKKQSEQKYLGLFKNSAIGIGIIAPNGKILEVNYTFSKMIKYSIPELLKMRVQNFYRDKSLDRKLTYILKDTPQGSKIETKLYRKDNTSFWAIIVFRLIEYEGHPAYITTAMDINDRKIAEYNLKAQEEQFRLIFQNSPFPMVIIKNQYEIVRINPQFTLLFGYEQHEIPSVLKLLEKISYKDYSTAEFIDIWKEDLTQIQEEEIIEHQFTMFSKDDDIHEVTSKLVKLDKDTALTILEDFTEFNNAKQALEASEKRYRLLVETSNDLIFSLDTKGRFLYINNAFTRVIGYTFNEIIDKNSRGLAHPDDVSILIRALEELLTGKLIKRLEYRAITKNNEIVYLSANLNPSFNENGEIESIFGSARDITEEIRVQQEKEQTEELYRRVVETSNDVIFISDLEGNYRFLNLANTRVLGYPLEELMQMNGFSLIHPNDLAYVMKEIQPVLAGKRVYNIRYRYRHRNGEYLYLSTNGTPLKDSEGNVTEILGIARNITEIRKKNRELQEKEIRIQHSQVTSMISSMLVHDIGQIKEKIKDILKTIGNSIGTDHIILLRHDRSATDLNYTVEGSFLSKGKTLDSTSFHEFLQIDEIKTYLTKIPSSIYKIIKITELSSPNLPDFIRNDFHEILMIPIFQSGDRYGTLFLNISTENAFDQRTISLCLNVALLIGLGIENAYNQEMLNQLFQTLSNISVGIYIIQENEDGKYPFVYVNEHFCNIWGLTEEELLGFESYGVLLGENIKQKFEIFTKARLAGKEFPNKYRMIIPYRGEEKNLMFSISLGLLNNRPAIFGMCSEFKEQTMLTFEEIYEKYLKE